MRQDSLLKKRLKIFLTKNKGTHEKLNDPSKPKNWAVTDNTKRKIRNISTKFINSQDYKNYLKELKIIKEEWLKLDTTPDRDKPYSLWHKTLDTDEDVKRYLGYCVREYVVDKDMKKLPKKEQFETFEFI